MHEHDQGLALFVFHDQRLHHRERIEPQHLGAVLRTAMLQVFVGMLGERHLVRPEERGGWGFGDVFFPGHALAWAEMDAGSSPA